MCSSTSESSNLDANMIQKAMITDCNFRLSLPVLRKGAIKPGMIWGVIKDLIGKDLSKISLPVFINEPLTAL